MSPESLATRQRFLDGTDVPSDYLALVHYYADGAMEAELFFTLDELEQEITR